MKKIYAFTFALMVLLTMAMSAEALEYKTISRDNGVSGNAYWIETTGDINTETNLYVTESNGGTYISLYIYTYDMMTGTWSDKWGSMSTQDDVFSMDKKLNSASLSDVQIDVYDWYNRRIGNHDRQRRLDWHGRDYKEQLQIDVKI